MAKYRTKVFKLHQIFLRNPVSSLFDSSVRGMLHNIDRIQTFLVSQVYIRNLAKTY